MDRVRHHYWPALYFADARGQIRHHHFGEGEYQQSEIVIQQLLADAGSGGAGYQQPPDAADEADVNGNGHGTATGQRLYQLIRQAGPITDRTLEISFPGPGIQVYAFTFG
jgi:thioredoxin family protein